MAARIKPQPHRAGRICHLEVSTLPGIRSNSPFREAADRTGLAEPVRRLVLNSLTRKRAVTSVRAGEISPLPPSATGGATPTRSDLISWRTRPACNLAEDQDEDHDDQDGAETDIHLNLLRVASPLRECFEHAPKEFIGALTMVDVCVAARLVRNRGAACSARRADPDPPCGAMPHSTVICTDTNRSLP